MKIKILFVPIFLLIVNTINAQTSFDKWPEMKSFHEVMSQTFHPAEEGNFEPIKTRSEELMHKAQFLLKANIPEEYRTKAVLKSLEDLQSKSENLNTLVKTKATDANLLKSITDLHQTFHEIMGLCSDDKK